MALIETRHSESFSRLQRGRYLLESGHPLIISASGPLSVLKHLRCIPISWPVSLAHQAFHSLFFLYPDFTHSSKHSSKVTSFRKCFLISQVGITTPFIGKPFWSLSHDNLSWKADLFVTGHICNLLAQGVIQGQRKQKHLWKRGLGGDFYANLDTH